VHEKIYHHGSGNKEAGGGLPLHLRNRPKSLRKRGSEREKRCRIEGRVMIDERPVIVEERSWIEDWDINTVIGKPGAPVPEAMFGLGQPRHTHRLRPGRGG